MMRRSMLAAFAAAAFGTSALADTEWRFQVTPYAWAPSLNGKVRPTTLTIGPVSAPTFSVNKPFREILKDLDGAFFLHGTLRRDRFVLFGDFTWAAVSESRHSTLLGILPAAAKVKVSQTSTTLLAGYSFVQEPAFTFDVLGGARAWRIEGSASASVGAVGISVGRTEKWADPIVAARMRANLSPNWSLILYGDYGGFGVGAKSTWQAVGALTYQVTEHLHLSVGYRHMSFDYRNDGRFLDLDMSGPLLGATWRF